MKNLLVVEDNGTQRYLFTKELGQQYSLDFATTPALAIFKLKTLKYDAVILDINLNADITGLDVIAKIKQDRHDFTIPVIAVTAYGDLFTQQEALKAGCNHVIFKPYSVPALIATIEGT